MRKRTPAKILKENLIVGGIGFALITLGQINCLLLGEYLALEILIWVQAFWVPAIVWWGYNETRRAWLGEDPDVKRDEERPSTVIFITLVALFIVLHGIHKGF